MNITLQTNNFNSNSTQYNTKFNNQSNIRKNYNQPSFNGGIDIPTKSKVLSPFTKAMDRFTTWLSDKYTTKLYTSRFAKFLAQKADNLNSVVDHMQVMGSVIISGMYMTQTLRNKQLDDDRKKTLAINQGLTFALSTVGSYVIDDALDSKWEKFTIKYAAKEMNDNKLAEKLAAINTEKLAKFEADKLKGIIPKEAKFKPTSVLQYVSENMPHTGLEERLKGMGVLKKLLVFGTVYRFIAPVAVTPMATWIGNKFVHKNNKNEAKTADQPKNVQEQTTQQNKTEQLKKSA